MSFGSLKTEAGIKELNDILATKSFVGGGAQASQDDFNAFGQLSPVVDLDAFPHAQRWRNTIKGLKNRFPNRNWARSGVAAQGGGGTGGSKDQANLEGLLKGAVDGKVCTRFPPEPSGYLHIGHAKAATLNNHYARMYNGKLILRFDDTNPSKEKMEFEESIKEDLAKLKIFPDQISHTSDHFEKLQEEMEKVIKAGRAYCDNTDVETMRAERDVGTESKCRKASVDENLRIWKEMLAGSKEGLTYCVRGKLNMQDKNKCLRDPVFYRCKVDTPHHKHGTKYKAYPTYDFACPVVDSIEGVSHALRTIEYKDRDAMYEWVIEATGSRHVELIEFAKTQFSHTILSKRKLTWFVENGHVEGWNDPRFPTVQGVLRRGMTVEALTDFALTQGMSKATNLMEWDKIWAINKQKIDPIVPRYGAVAKEDAVLLKLDGPKEPVSKVCAAHQKNAELGDRLIIKCNEVWIEQEDAQAIGLDGDQQVTLLHWGNVFIDKVNKDKTGKVIGMTGRVNAEGNVKDTKKKVHWVGKLDDQVTPIILREFDHIVTKAKIEDDDNMVDLINHNSIIDTEAIGDPLLKTLKIGDKMQLERRGYFIVDVAAFPPGKTMVLIKIPDGKAKDTGMKSKVDPAKLQGSQTDGKKEEGKGKKDEKKAAPEAATVDAKAQPAAATDAKPDAKPKAKGKPAPAGKPADRPVEDVSRLNIVVGRINKVWPHESAEKLYCEEIDLGESSGPRTIASGLRAHLKESDMEGKLVIVLANLKPRKMQGFESQGMVMCATGSAGNVELMKVPDGAKVGERVTIEGVDMLDADDKLNEKTGKNPWVATCEGFKTNAKKQGTYNGHVMMTSAGPVTSSTVADGGKIS